VSAITTWIWPEVVEDRNVLDVVALTVADEPALVLVDARSVREWRVTSTCLGRTAVIRPPTRHRRRLALIVHDIKVQEAMIDFMAAILSCYQEIDLFSNEAAARLWLVGDAEYSMPS
jgi:hypothetical protein